MAKTQDPRPFTNVRFDTFDTKALVDTGSEVSILDFKSFCQLAVRPQLRPAPFSIKSASNTRIPVRGIAHLMITMGGRKMLRPFCIIDTKIPERKCIIGADTLLEERIPVPMSRQEENNQNPVRLTEAITLSPFSEKLVSVKVPIDQGIGVVQAQIEPKPLFNDSLISVKNGTAKMVVQNLQTLPISLARNDKIGNFETISPDNMVQIKEVNELRTGVSKAPKCQHYKRRLNDELDLSKIPENMRSLYKKLVFDNSDIFSIDPNDIGDCRSLPQKIRLVDQNKVACIPPYRIPYHLQHVVEDYVQKLLAAGVIQKSDSPFSSPLMLVKKANAKPSQPIVEQYRVVHDYRQLNANTVKDSYPMHNLYDLIDKVSQAKVWSVIDLSSGFWNQRLDPESRKYTAFGVPGKGHFEYTRSAQGLCNSPPSFQRLLDFITRDIPNVYVYVDDVVVCSTTHEEHLHTLQLLFEKFREFNLKCRMKKVQLGTTEINYLGYNLSKAMGIRPGLAKTIAVRNWKEPTNVKEVKQFLGLCSFFRRTIRDFASIASPLTKLTRKDSKWISGALPTEARKSFKNLQDSLCKRPCLSPVDFSKEFILTVDASTVGLGAVLSQIDDIGIERPCAYASRTLNETEQKRAPFHLEYLAMVWACRHFKPYLAGQHFTIRTDHKPLMALNKTQGATFERLQMELEEFQPYTIKYINGSQMPADGLSRLSEGINISLAINNKQLQDLQQQDIQAKAIFCYLKFGGLPRQRNLFDFVKTHARQFVIKEGLLGRLVNDRFLPYAPRGIRDTILRLAHDDLTAGHKSSEKTLQRILSSWVWPMQKDDVDVYCRSCTVCNVTNLPSHKRPLPLEPFEPVSHFNERVHLDLLGPLPLSENAKYLLVCIDAFSKLVEFVPIPNKEMETVSTAFFNHWICRHGICMQLHSDLGKEFANSMFDSLSKRFQFTQSFSSVSHPQSNGQAERQIRTTISFLRKYLNGKNDWTVLLPAIACAHNTTVHSTTKYTPYMAAYSRLPRLPLSLGSNHTYSDCSLDQTLALASKVRIDIEKNQQNAFLSMKLQFDKRAKEKCVQIGDVVFLERAHRGSQFQKFQTPYEGPFRVIKEGLHNNVFIEPLSLHSTSKTRKALWVHKNLLKLAPFARQITSFPDVQIAAPKPRRQQYQPKPQPTLLPGDPDEDDFVVGHPEATQRVQIQPEPSNEMPTPSAAPPPEIPAPQSQPVLPSPPTHAPSPPVSPQALPTSSNVPSQAQADSSTGARSRPSPLRRVLRSIGMPLPDSVLSNYPKERKKKKPVQTDKDPTGTKRRQKKS